MGLKTSPGGVLGVCAVAETMEQAHAAAYELVEQMDFAGIGRWKLVSRMERV
jgi:phosphoribosylamine-glycine ligase